MNNNNNNVYLISLQLYMKLNRKLHVGEMLNCIVWYMTSLFSLSLLSFKILCVEFVWSHNFNKNFFFLQKQIQCYWKTVEDIENKRAWKLSVLSQEFL